MHVRTGAGLALGLSLVLGLAACGGTNHDNGVATGGKPGGTSGPTSGGTGNEQEAMLKFAQCMRDHGIQMDDPQPGGGIKLPEVVDPQKADAAMQQCKQYLPNGGQPQKPDPAQLEQLRKFAQCMRDHGIQNFPDPDANNGLQLDPGKLGLDPKDPKLVAAQNACAKYQPAGPSGAPNQITQTSGNG
jgi:hypothetical protein